MIKLSEKDKNAITKQADGTIADYVKNVPTIVRGFLDKAMLSVLGLEQEYHDKIRVSNSNGRDTVIGNAIKERCLEAVNEVIKPLVDKALEQIKVNPEIIAAITKETKDTFVSCLKRAITEKAQKYAEAQARAVVEGLKDADFSGIFPKNIETEDPNSYETKVGEIILEEVARHMSKNKKKGGPRVVNRLSEGRRTVVIIDDEDNL